MFKLLSYKKKLKLLPWIAALVFLLVYWFAISETIKLRREVKSLLKETTAIETAPAAMRNLKKKLDEINILTGNRDVTTGTDPLMELTSRLSSAHSVILSEYQPNHIFRYQNYNIETRIVSFESSFIPCLKVLNDIEKDYRNGNVVSVKYYTRTDNSTSKKHLTMQILIQSIKNEKSNTSEDGYTE